MKDFITGIRCYLDAHSFIFKHRLFQYLLIPGFISIFYVVVMIILGIVYMDSITSHIMMNWLPGYLQGNVMEIFLLILLWISLFLLLFITYRHIVLAILSPFLSTLSERTESIVKNKPALKFQLKQALKDLIRGIRINLRIMILSIIFSLLAWLLVLLPVIGAFLSLILSVVIQSYYGGFALYDYSLERKRLSAKQSVDYIKKHRAAVTGVGLGFFILSLIPLIGWFLAPTYGTVAATLMILEER